jgi:SAM-dependent methyltransferase
MEREKKDFKESGGSGTYGILTDEGVKDMLMRAKKALGGSLKGKLFCDVGSGDGEAIFSALDQFPELKGVLGVELSKFRHDRASAHMKEFSKDEQARIELRHEDGLKTDLSKADIIYVSNLLAEERFNVAFGKICDRQLKAGTLVFVINPVPFKRAPKESKELTGEAECSWGTPIVLGYKMGATIEASEKKSEASA